MFNARLRSPILIGVGSAIFALTLVGCGSGTTAAPVTSTVTNVVTTAVVQTATVTTTDTVAGPRVTVMKTTTKPAPPPVTRVVIKTSVTTKTPAVVTVTSEAPTTEQESSADDAGAARLAEAQQAADDIAEAASAAGWTGPICDPDVNLHRKEAGQEQVSDSQLAEYCEANVEKAKTQIANNPPSEDARPDQATVQDTVQANYDHVKKVLGINRDPSSGEVQIVYACEHGYATPDECSVVHEEWDD